MRSRRTSLAHVLLSVASLAAPLTAQERPGTTALPPVTVASRVGADAARAVQVLDRVFLDQVPGASVQAALALALGGDLQSRSPAQAELALRGGSYEQTLVLVDGHRMRDLQTGHFALDLAVPWEAIERIEILRGPAAAQYGADAVGGAINIVTRRTPDRGTGAARLRTGTDGLLDAALSFGARLAATTTASVSVDRLHTDGHRPDTDADITQFRSAVQRQGSRSRLRVDLGYGARDFGAATFYAPYNSYERTRTGTVGVQVDAAPTGRVATTARLGLRTHADDFILVRTDPARYRNQHRSLQAEGELGLRMAVTPTTTLAIGTEAMLAQLRSARLGNRQQLRGALFSEGRQQWGHRATAFLGARLDAGTGVGAVLIPSGGVTVAMTQASLLRVTYAGGWRQPTWTDRYYVDPANRGTPSLTPERFGSAEVGVAWSPHVGGRVDLAAFARDGQHTIDWVRRAGMVPAEPWVASNVGSVRVRGVELLATAPEIWGVRWSLRGTTVQAHTDVMPGIEGKYALRPLTTSAGVTARLGNDARWMMVDVAHAQRRGEQAYTTASARAGMALRGRAHGALLTLEGTNVGRARALDASGVPMPGPAFALGVQWRR